MRQEIQNNGNRLIENIMGSTIKVEQEDVKDIPLAFLSIEDMKFHCSWKWLMPVVVKIEEDLGYTITISGKTCSIEAEGETFEHEGDTKMEAVWQAIVKCLDATQ